MAMKKLNYTLTVYKNTGFNGIDIPKSGSVLDNADHTVYNDVYYLREDYDLPQISVNDNYHNLADVDYVKLVSNDLVPTVFYYFAEPHAAAGNTTILNLELDALTTMGGAGNLNYTSGWMERGHIAKTEDHLFKNIASEDWAPLEPLECTPYNYVKEDISGYNPHPDEDLQIIISNIDLVELSKNYVDGNYLTEVISGVLNEDLPSTDSWDPGEISADAVMHVPLIKASPNSSIFVIETYDQNDKVSANSLQIPNTVAYDITNPVVKHSLDMLFSTGQLQLQSSFTIPKEFIRYKGRTEQGAETHFTEKTEDGRYIVINGYNYLYEADDIPFEYNIDGYQIKNKKCFSMFRNVTLANVSSGAQVIRPIYELSYGENSCPIIDVWSDPITTGKPNARFMTDVGNRVAFSDVCLGSQWIPNQIVMEGASGSLWNNISSAFNDATYAIAMNENQLNAQMAQTNLEYERSTDDLNYIKQLKGSLGGIIKNSLPGPSGSAGDINVGLPNVGGAFYNAGDMLLQTAQHLNTQALYDARSLYNELYYGNVTAGRARIFENENRLNLIKNNRVVTPSVMFTPEPNLAMYGFNKFIVFETKLKTSDIISLDRYFQRYGYNGLHKPLTSECFMTRQFYNYVQAFDVNIKSNDKAYGMRIRNKAISQLNKGVRVWNVLPDASYYELN